MNILLKLVKCGTGLKKSDTDVSHDTESFVRIIFSYIIFSLLDFIFLHSDIRIYTRMY